MSSGTTEGDPPKPPRLDLWLVQIGLARSRNQAQQFIRSGKVLVNQKIQTKPSFTVPPAAQIEVLASDEQYVSRGGLKLKAAIDFFHFQCKDKVIADIGASTGGFTDCLLQHGAKKVYAIDVGKDQLASKLQRDPRVIIMDQCNIRHVKALPEQVDAIVGDLSFISLTKVISALQNIIKTNGEAILLIKPQFEVGPHKTQRGRVQDPVLRKQAIAAVKAAFLREQITILGHIPSPIPGAKKGNIEELIHLRFTSC